MLGSFGGLKRIDCWFHSVVGEAGWEVHEVSCVASQFFILLSRVRGRTETVPLTTGLGIELELELISYDEIKSDQATQYLIVKPIGAARCWVFQFHDIVTYAFSKEPWDFDASNWPTRCIRGNVLEIVGAFYFREIDTPWRTSATASLTTSGVSRFSVPRRSFLSSLSNIPHAQPWGIPLTGGRSSKLGRDVIVYKVIFDLIRLVYRGQRPRIGKPCAKMDC